MSPTARTCSTPGFEAKHPYGLTEFSARTPMPGYAIIREQKDWWRTASSARWLGPHWRLGRLRSRRDPRALPRRPLPRGPLLRRPLLRRTENWTPYICECVKWNLPWVSGYQFAVSLIEVHRIRGASVRCAVTAPGVVEKESRSTKSINDLFKARNQHSWYQGQLGLVDLATTNYAICKSVGLVVFRTFMLSQVYDLNANFFSDDQHMF